MKGKNVKWSPNKIIQPNSIQVFSTYCKWSIFLANGGNNFYYLLFHWSDLCSCVFFSPCWLGTKQYAGIWIFKEHALCIPQTFQRIATMPNSTWKWSKTAQPSLIQTVQTVQTSHSSSTVTSRPTNMLVLPELTPLSKSATIFGLCNCYCWKIQCVPEYSANFNR